MQRWSAHPVYEKSVLLGCFPSGMHDLNDGQIEKTMRRVLQLVGLCYLASVACIAGGAEATRSVLDFGEWKARESLRPFWSGINRDWWPEVPAPALLQYCEQFARRTTPEELLPEMMLDLKADYAVTRHAIYCQVAIHWPSDRTLPLLRRYEEGDDPTTRRLAVDFVAEIEEAHQGARPNAAEPPPPPGTAAKS